MTAEQSIQKPKQSRAEYFREYRRRNPEKVKQWRDNYIMRRAAKLAALAADGDNGVKGGGSGGGN